MELLKAYIVEELNVIGFSLEADESPYVVYNTDPDHKAIGQALKKAFTKEMKAKIADLTTEECEAYMRDGKIELLGAEMQEGWLKISKQFN